MRPIWPNIAGNAVSIQRRSQHGDQRVNRQTIGIAPALRALVKRRRKRRNGSKNWRARAALWPRRPRCSFSEKRLMRSGGGGATRTRDQHPTSPNRSYSDQRGRHRWRAARQSLCRVGDQRSHFAALDEKRPGSLRSTPARAAPRTSQQAERGGAHGRAGCL